MVSNDADENTPPRRLTLEGVRGRAHHHSVGGRSPRRLRIPHVEVGAPPRVGRNLWRVDISPVTHRMCVGQSLSLQTMSVVRGGVVMRYSPVNCSVRVKTGKDPYGSPFMVCSSNPMGCGVPQSTRRARMNFCDRIFRICHEIFRFRVTKIFFRHKRDLPPVRPVHSNHEIMSPGAKLWLAGRQPSPVAGCPR